MFGVSYIGITNTGKLGTVCLLAGKGFILYRPIFKLFFGQLHRTHFRKVLKALQ